MKLRYGDVPPSREWDRLDLWDEPPEQEMPTWSEAIVFVGIVAVVLLACIVGIQG